MIVERRDAAPAGLGRILAMQEKNSHGVISRNRVIGFHPPGRLLHAAVQPRNQPITEARAAKMAKPEIEEDPPKSPRQDHIVATHSPRPGFAPKLGVNPDQI